MIEDFKNKIKHFDLFSGFGGFTIACESVGIETIGFSEIDKWANAVLRYRFPNIKNYGDITKIIPSKLPDFDLLTFGSPCQDLSIAKKNREGLSGSRSSLFYNAVDILKIKKPKWFIMENVASMGKENKEIITKILKEIYPDTECYSINASLVSAQNRRRLFWTNIPNITQPTDKGILLKDILESGIPSEYNRLTGIKIGKGKSQTISASDWRGLNRNQTQTCVRIGQIGKGGQGDRIYSPEGKSVGLSALGGGRAAKTGLYLIQGGEKRTRSGKKQTELNKQEKANAITSVQTDSMVAIKDIIRKLTPIECERLMTLKNDWTKYGIDEKGNQIEISNSQRYRLCGNGIVIEVVKGIVEKLFI